VAKQPVLSEQKQQAQIEEALGRVTDINADEVCRTMGGVKIEWNGVWERESTRACARECDCKSEISDRQTGSQRQQLHTTSVRVRQQLHTTSVCVYWLPGSSVGVAFWV